MKKKNYISIILVVLITLSCVCTTGNILGKNIQKNIIKTNDETEYWALIVGVNKIGGLPDADKTSGGRDHSNAAKTLKVIKLKNMLRIILFMKISIS